MNPGRVVRWVAQPPSKEVAKMEKPVQAAMAARDRTLCMVIALSCFLIYTVWTV
jgi:hypothetical protein